MNNQKEFQFLKISLLQNFTFGICYGYTCYSCYGVRKFLTIKLERL